LLWKNFTSSGVENQGFSYIKLQLSCFASGILPLISNGLPSSMDKIDDFTKVAVEPPSSGYRF